ncbi:hypothetical protein AWENTII_011811 [Aspergillus wentii]
MALHLRMKDDDPWIIESKIFTLLSDYLQPNSSITPSSAASTIDSLYPANRNEEEAEQPYGFLWEIWYQIYHVSGQIMPSDPAMEKLALLVKTLRGVRSKTALIAVEGYGGEMRLWADLPLIGSVYRELFDYDVELDNRGRGINALAARLYRDGLPWKFFAIEAINSLGVRERRRHQHTTEMVTEDTIDDNPEFRAELDIAADWITQCGEVILQGRTDEVSGAQIWSRPWGFEEPVVYPAMWGEWKKKFQKRMLLYERWVTLNNYS